MQFPAHVGVLWQLSMQQLRNKQPSHPDPNFCCSTSHFDSQREVQSDSFFLDLTKLTLFVYPHPIRSQLVSLDPLRRLPVKCSKMRSPRLLAENSWETKMWAPSALTGSSHQQYPPLESVATGRGPHPCLNYERLETPVLKPQICSARAFLTCPHPQAHWEPTMWLAAISVRAQRAVTQLKLSQHTSYLGFPWLSNQSILEGRADKSPVGAAHSVCFIILCLHLPLPLLSLGAWRPSGSRGTPTTRRGSWRKGRASIENTQTLRNYMWAPVHVSSAETSSHTVLLTRLTMGLGTSFANTRARTSRGYWGCLNRAAPSFRTESLPGCPGSTVFPTWPLAHRTSVSWRGPGQSSYNQDDFA